MRQVTALLVPTLLVGSVLFCFFFFVLPILLPFMLVFCVVGFLCSVLLGFRLYGSSFPRMAWKSYRASLSTDVGLVELFLPVQFLLAMALGLSILALDFSTFMRPWVLFGVYLGIHEFPRISSLFPPPLLILGASDSRVVRLLHLGRFLWPLKFAHMISEGAILSLFGLRRLSGAFELGKVSRRTPDKDWFRQVSSLIDTARIVLIDVSSSSANVEQELDYCLFRSPGESIVVLLSKNTRSYFVGNTQLDWVEERQTLIPPEKTVLVADPVMLLLCMPGIGWRLVRDGSKAISELSKLRARRSRLLFLLVGRETRERLEVLVRDQRGEIDPRIGCLLNSLAEARRRITIIRIRSIATAMMEWLTLKLESGSLKAEVRESNKALHINGSKYPEVSHCELKLLLVPEFLEHLHHEDAWGQEMRFALNPSFAESNLVAVWSRGGGEPIIWVDGWFLTERDQ